jgi:hypothetical protein
MEGAWILDMRFEQGFRLKQLISDRLRSVSAGKSLGRVEFNRSSPDDTECFHGRSCGPIRIEYITSSRSAGTGRHRSLEAGIG